VLLQVVWYVHQCSTASTGKEVQRCFDGYLSGVDVRVVHVRRRTTSVCDLWLRLETLIRMYSKSHDSAADQQLKRAHSKTAACPVQEHTPIIYRCQPCGIPDPSLEEVTIVLHTYIESTGQEFAGRCLRLPSWSTHQHARHWRRAMVIRATSPEGAGNNRSMLTDSGTHSGMLPSR
jgi:hypothetical protein